MGKLHRELSKHSFMRKGTLFRFFPEFREGKALSLQGGRYEHEHVARDASRYRG